MNREPPAWSPREYLKFERERTLPCRDLVARIDLKTPRVIVDLGCGPGNSTAVLAERWPEAKLLGVDNSPAMLEAARSSSVNAEWLLTDMRDWAPKHPFDIVFSNAALQWIPDQHTSVPHLFGSVAEGGAFAIQIPSGEGAWTQAIKEVAGRSEWSGRFPKNLLELQTHDLGFYYDLLSPLSRQVDLWETEYVHVFAGIEDIVEWTKGTALRPLLDRLPQVLERASFLEGYTAAITKAYPNRPDGNVLFSFLRRFVIAYR